MWVQPAATSLNQLFYEDGLNQLFVSEGLKLASESRMKRQLLVPVDRMLPITCRALIVCGWWRIKIVDTEETKILPLSQWRRWFAICL